MSDEKALLAVIWEHPHEDTPRLIYADWLDEHGQPERAEFIRVQIELAKVNRWDDAPEPALKQREKELWTKWRRRWRSHLPKPRRKCQFHRGFPMFDLNAYEFRDFLKLTVADLESAPLSRYYRDICGPEVLKLLNWPGLRFQEYFTPSEPQLPKGWVKQVAE